MQNQRVHIWKVTIAAHPLSGWYYILAATEIIATTSAVVTKAERTVVSATAAAEEEDDYPYAAISATATITAAIVAT